MSDPSGTEEALRVVLVRHAESVWHADNRYAGASDIELTEHGRAQAERLAVWAKDADLDAVRCSPLRRARETAEPVAHAAGLELGVDERLVELDFGVAEGLTSAELDRHRPDDLAAFRRDPVGHHFPDGEPPEAAVARQLSFLDSLPRGAGRVMVVGHSTSLRLLLCRLLGLPISEYRRTFPRLDNCALTELEVRDDAAALLGFNVAVAP